MPVDPADFGASRTGRSPVQVPQHPRHLHFAIQSRRARLRDFAPFRRSASESCTAFTVGSSPRQMFRISSCLNESACYLVHEIGGTLLLTDETQVVPAVGTHGWQAVAEATIAPVEELARERNERERHVEFLLDAATEHRMGALDHECFGRGSLFHTSVRCRCRRASGLRSGRRRAGTSPGGIPCPVP